MKLASAIAVAVLVYSIIVCDMVVQAIGGLDQSLFAQIARAVSR